MIYIHTKGRWRLEWENIGEGMEGDYQEEDPLDVPLLRTYLLRYSEIKKEWKEVYSLCTLAPVETPAPVLAEMSEDLMKDLEKFPVYQCRIPMEKWTWRTRHGRTA